jgi:hypothetical protein
VAPVITGMNIHFMFHIHCTSIHKFLYLVSASLCMTFLSTDIGTSISMHSFSFFVFNYYSFTIGHNFSSCMLLLLLITMQTIQIRRNWNFVVMTLSAQVYQARP